MFLISSVTCLLENVSILLGEVSHLSLLGSQRINGKVLQLHDRKCFCAFMMKQ